MFCGCCIDWFSYQARFYWDYRWVKKKILNGGKDKQSDLLEWHKWSHMEKQDEKSPICDEIASAGVYYN